eukprot:m.9868 g.9868  ORF g.9868 m.9868 type:complete len:415 (+) comp2684_c0_seq1:549-1793(+)
MLSNASESAGSHTDVSLGSFASHQSSPTHSHGRSHSWGSHTSAPPPPPPQSMLVVPGNMGATDTYTTIPSSAGFILPTSSAGSSVRGSPSPPRTRHYHRDHPWQALGRRLFWLALGFRSPPSWDVVHLLVMYACSASVMLALNKHLARSDRFNTIMLLQLQLGTSLAAIGIGKLTGQIDLTLSVTKGGPHEMYAWMTLSVMFAIQLVASVRTLQTHHITEWYMMLHYLTPVAVPLLERHVPVTEEADVRPPLTVIIFPLITLTWAGIWSYTTTGVFGPGTTSGALWSFVWIAARVSTMVGSRMAILRYQTPIWNRLLYQNLGAFTVFATIVTLYPAAVELSGHHNENEPLSMPLVLQYMLLILSCATQVLVAWARLSILGKTTASTFAILSSVGVMPARLYYSGYRLFDANPHH